MKFKSTISYLASTDGLAGECPSWRDEGTQQSNLSQSNEYHGEHYDDVVLPAGRVTLARKKTRFCKVTGDATWQAPLQL